MFEPVCCTGSVNSVNLPVVFPSVGLKDVFSTVVSEAGVQPSNTIRKIMIYNNVCLV